MKLRRTALAALFLTSVLSTVLMAAPAQALPGGAIINIGVFNADLRLCLKPSGFNNGAVVIQVQCDGLAGQAWNPLIIDNASHFNLVSVGTGKCLDVAGGRALDRATVIVNPCNGSSGQRWTISPGGAAEFRSGVAGTNSHCLDLPGGTPAPNAAMQIFSCNNTQAQRWLF
ncbi:hypothetical protein GCM10022419_088210 [Nonomuraea rosea]|uniref:Ricin B lectin domain-containing protein n=1 Tax=Nonomuraea rosea TaxID=638574 RepID=A0ABP6YUQ6_9ACTN